VKTYTSIAALKRLPAVFVFMLLFLSFLPEPPPRSWAVPWKTGDLFFDVRVNPVPDSSSLAGILG